MTEAERCSETLFLIKMEEWKIFNTTCLIPKTHLQHRLLIYFSGCTLLILNLWVVKASIGFLGRGSACRLSSTYTEQHNREICGSKAAFELSGMNLLRSKNLGFVVRTPFSFIFYNLFFRISVISHLTWIYTIEAEDNLTWLVKIDGSYQFHITFK